MGHLDIFGLSLILYNKVISQLFGLRLENGFLGLALHFFPISKLQTPFFGMQIMKPLVFLIFFYSVVKLQLSEGRLALLVGRYLLNQVVALVAYHQLLVLCLLDYDVLLHFLEYFQVIIINS